jgi:sugar phosphate permease
MGVASVCFAFLSSYAAFACCWFVMRYAQTACFPSMGRVAKGWWSEEEIPSAWGFLATSCRVGAIVAFFVLGPLLAVVHWRGIYVFAGLLAIVVFAYNYRLLRDHPEASTPTKMRKFSAAVINPSSETDYPLKAFAGECVQSEKVWLMLGGMACLTAITEIPSILPMYFRDMHFKDNSTMSHAAASTMVVSYPIGSCLATLCCGQIYDSLNRKQQMYLISSLLAGACCCFIALWVMDLQRGPNDDPQLIKTIVILFFIGVFTAPCYYLPPTFFAMKFGGMKFYATLACALDAAGYMCSILFFQVVGRRGKAGINWNEVLFTLVVLMFATTGFFVRFMWLEVEKPTKAALEGLDT